MKIEFSYLSEFNSNSTPIKITMNCKTVLRTLFRSKWGEHSIKKLKIFSFKIKEENFGAKYEVVKHAISKSWPQIEKQNNFDESLNENGWNKYFWLFKSTNLKKWWNLNPI